VTALEVLAAEIASIAAIELLEKLRAAGRPATADVPAMDTPVPEEVVRSVARYSVHGSEVSEPCL
jgi:hypothetical protein